MPLIVQHTAASNCWRLVAVLAVVVLVAAVIVGAGAALVFEVRRVLCR